MGFDSANEPVVFCYRPWLIIHGKQTGRKYSIEEMREKRRYRKADRLHCAVNNNYLENKGNTTRTSDWSGRITF